MHAANPAPIERAQDVPIGVAVRGPDFQQEIGHLRRPLDYNGGMDWLLLCGAILTTNLGEANPGYLCGSELSTDRARVEVMADTQDKYTSAGWSWRASGDYALPHRLTIGAGFVHRDGGPWTKDTIRARFGYRPLAQTALTYSVDLWQDAGMPNRVQSLEWRQAASWLDLRTALYRYRATPKTHSIGVSTQIGFRVGRSHW